MISEKGRIKVKEMHFFQHSFADFNVFKALYFIISFALEPTFWRAKPSFLHATITYVPFLMLKSSL